jgi:hypothetical protein
MSDAFGLETSMNKYTRFVSDSFLLLDRWASDLNRVESLPVGLEAVGGAAFEDKSRKREHCDVPQVTGCGIEQTCPEWRGR